MNCPDDWNLTRFDCEVTRLLESNKVCEAPPPKIFPGGENLKNDAFQVGNMNLLFLFGRGGCHFSGEACEDFRGANLFCEH